MSLLKKWCVFDIIIICGLQVLAEAPKDDAAAIQIWRDSSSQLDDFKISYETKCSPTQSVLASVNKASPPGVNGVKALLTQMLTQRHTLINMTRKGAQWRYEIKEDISPFDMDKLAKTGQPYGQFTVANDNVEIYSTAGLYFLDNLHHIGAFRSEWPTRPESPLLLVLSPDVESVSMPIMRGSNIIEVRDKSSSTVRQYHLDPKFGMMPTEVDFFHTEKDGSLFLYKFVKIDKYFLTQQGAFIPELGVTYDFVSNEGGKLNWITETSFKLVKSDIGLDIPNAEFKLVYPPGTQVTDYTINVDYVIPNSGKNPTFSILNMDKIIN